MTEFTGVTPVIGMPVQYFTNSMLLPSAGIIIHIWEEERLVTVKVFNSRGFPSVLKKVPFDTGCDPICMDRPLCRALPECYKPKSKLETLKLRLDAAELIAALKQESATIERPVCKACGGGTKSTGLPGNNCESCMNTGFDDATAADLAPSYPSEVEAVQKAAVDALTAEQPASPVGTTSAEVLLGVIDLAMKMAVQLNDYDGEMYDECVMIRNDIQSARDHIATYIEDTNK